VDPRWGKVGKQKIVDEGPLPPHPTKGVKYDMETVDDHILKFTTDFMEKAKQTADLHTPTLTQFIALEAIRRGVVDETINKAKILYRAKRDAMIEALDTYMCKEAWWPRPVGGLFVMVFLPSYDIDTKKMLMEAIDAGVAYVPGASFFANGMGWNTMRLNFSYPSPEEIREGVRIIADLVKEKIKEKPTKITPLSFFKGE